MSSTTHDTNETLRLAGDARGPRLFIASVGRFDDAMSRSTMDGLVEWIENQYREDLLKRSSKHIYIRKLPVSVIEKIDQLRGSTKIYEQILKQFPKGYVITPMKHTDELYISHYNKDKGGDQGLYDKHYDGNLRFLQYGAVVRALIYLQSDATYKVIFHDSRVEKAFVTYDFGLLDFHRELHWVEGEYNPADQQRILLKCNYLITPRFSGFAVKALTAANTAVFYVVKAAMEYSKSPTSLPQRFVGLLCNLFRVLNNIHPTIPIAFITGIFALAVWLIL